MPDINVDLFHQVSPVVPHIKHAAKHAAHAVPHIKQGISMLQILLSNLLTAIVFGGGAWYVRGRGIQGVKNDLANAQAEINKLKAQSTAAVDAAKAVA